jgi:hypothetical protein
MGTTNAKELVRCLTQATYNSIGAYDSTADWLANEENEAFRARLDKVVLELIYLQEIAEKKVFTTRK